MKKIVLFALLPAMLAVSACQFKGQSGVEGNLFLEDTLAHEEIFGNAAISEFSAKPKFAPNDPIEHPNNDYSIGVQSQPGSTENTISFRFVAPIRFEAGELNPTEAKWTRTVSKKDGSAYPKDTGQIECTTAYNAISYGASAYTISQYNSEHSTNFTHFVVYTLRNVPVDSNDYFVSAYLTLQPKKIGGEGGKELFNTKAVAINASNTQQYAYVHDLGYYFLDGTFNGTPNVVSPNNIRTVVEAEQYAGFTAVEITKNDTFVVKEFYNTKLYTHGATDVLKGTSNTIGDYFENDSGLVKAKLDGTFTFSFSYNNRGELWPTVTSVNKKMYIQVQIGAWGDAGGWTSLYAYGFTGENNAKVEKWFVLEEDGDYLKTTEAIDYSTYTALIVVRMDPVVDYGTWDHDWNQTEDIPMPLNKNNCIYVYGTSNSDIHVSVSTKS